MANESTSAVKPSCTFISTIKPGDLKKVETKGVFSIQPKDKAVDKFIKQEFGDEKIQYGNGYSEGLPSLATTIGGLIAGEAARRYFKPKVGVGSKGGRQLEFKFDDLPIAKKSGYGKRILDGIKGKAGLLIDGGFIAYALYGLGSTDWYDSNSISRTYKLNKNKAGQIDELDLSVFVDGSKENSAMTAKFKLDNHGNLSSETLEPVVDAENKDDSKTLLIARSRQEAKEVKKNTDSDSVWSDLNDVFFC